MKMALGPSDAALRDPPWPPGENSRPDSAGGAAASAIQETFRELYALLERHWPGSEVLAGPLAELAEALEQSFGGSGEALEITPAAKADLVQRIQCIEDCVWALELRRRGGRR